MLPTQLFYTGGALRCVQPFFNRTKKYQPTDSLDRFPLDFTNLQYDRKDINFFSQYLASNTYKVLFSAILEVMSHPNPNHAPTNLTSFIETRLLSKIKQKAYPYDIHIDPGYKLQICSASLKQKTKIRGVFMHRDLNMPYECYQVQRKKNNNIKMKLKKNIPRLDHLKMLDQKKTSYKSNNYELSDYYFDSYDNFIENEDVTREVIEINAIINGKLVFYGGKAEKQIRLPLNPDKPMTTHILQVQSINVPGRLWSQTTLITDIDYFMEGNIHTL